MMSERALGLGFSCCPASMTYLSPADRATKNCRIALFEYNFLSMNKEVEYGVTPCSGVWGVSEGNGAQEMLSNRW